MRARLIDPGAIFAGWVGLGMALVIVIAFALIIPLQTVPFLMAPFAGVLIGVYANVRAERWRPRARVLANAAWAGLVTGVGLALLYMVIRLVFLYGDTGAMPDGTRIACEAGPGCVYTRYVMAGDASDLALRGITNASLYETEFITRDLPISGIALIVLTVGGSLMGGAVRTFAPRPTSLPLPSAAPRMAGQ
ncbi:MAG: hypothetical protein ABI797_00835 [Chloroflexota bacterium]